MCASVSVVCKHMQYTNAQTASDISMAYTNICHELGSKLPPLAHQPVLRFLFESSHYVISQFWNSTEKEYLMKVNTIFQVRDNLGGRLLLAYDGADEDLTTFYIFYCNPRLSSFGFVTNKVIIRLCISTLSKSETNIINLKICKLQLVTICAGFLSTQFFIQKSWHLSYL